MQVLLSLLRAPDARTIGSRQRAKMLPLPRSHRPRRRPQCPKGLRKRRRGTGRADRGRAPFPVQLRSACLKRASGTRNFLRRRHAQKRTTTRTTTVGFPRMSQCRSRIASTPRSRILRLGRSRWRFGASGVTQGPWGRETRRGDLVRRRHSGAPREKRPRRWRHRRRRGIGRWSPCLR